MRFLEINKRYTELVMDYLNNGYCINAGTMGGSQGEIAHTDVTDGKTVIRIYVGIFRDSKTYTEGIEIIVGKCTDEYVKANKERTDTLWNNHLEVIKSEKFYKIGRENRNGEKFYGTLEEATSAIEKHHERYIENHKDNDVKEFTDKAKKIVLAYVKRQPKCKTVKAADIESVYRVTATTYTTGEYKNQYYVNVRGNVFRMK